MLHSNEERFIEWIKHGYKVAFGQSPLNFFKTHGFEEFSYLIDAHNGRQTMINCNSFIYNPTCIVCGNHHTKFVTWNKWDKTCSNECLCKSRSIRQIGENNSTHNMSDESKLVSNRKTSTSMKRKILDGSFTPKSDNYKIFGMIEFRYKNEIRKVRSLWELIYWIKHPDLEFEKIRVEYFDSVSKKNRIYITDFYDKESNTIIEIKPKKYKYTLVDKIKGISQTNYNYKIVDEDYFENIKDQTLIDEIKNVVVDYSKIESRLKWLKRK